MPVFSFRELHYEPGFDALWANWHKLKTRQQKSAEWCMFVDTFDQHYPAEAHFDAIPSISPGTVPNGNPCWIFVDQIVVK